MSPQEEKPFRKFADIGRKIAGGFGVQTAGDWDRAVRALDANQINQCLLCAMIEELQKLTSAVKFATLTNLFHSNERKDCDDAEDEIKTSGEEQNSKGPEAGGEKVAKGKGGKAVTKRKARTKSQGPGDPG